MDDVPAEKKAKPPPIYVEKTANIQPLISLLREIANDEHEIKILRKDEVKIQLKSTQAYSEIIKELQRKGTEFYTFKLKHERSFRVVLKNTSNNRY